MTEAGKRFTLRDLPIAAKLVVSCFLLAVGGGYTAAMVQLHMQDAKSGQALPTVHDVILKYTGKKWFANDKEIARPVCKLEKLIMGSTDPQAVFGSNGSMGPAFFTKDPSVGPKNYRQMIRNSPGKKAEIDAQREGERQLLKAWINADEQLRRSAYEADQFVPPAQQAPKAIDAEWKSGDGFKVKSLLETRCVACHGRGGPQENFPLESYEQIDKYLTVAAAASVGPNGGWVKVEEPMSMEKLTQSTHAHLLSFAMLFGLTGLVFAFTSYPGALRCVLGPWVLVAIVADVSLWWLARLSDQWGPYFAMGIIGTGGAVGVGLMLQITLSLLNMYGWKGKAVVLGLFVLAGLGVSYLYLNKVKPSLEEKQKTLAASTKTAEPPKENGSNGKGPENHGSNGKEPVVLEGAGGQVAKMLTVPAGVKNVLDIIWKAGKHGGMARAFFDKDGAEFSAAVKDKDKATQEKLMPERHGEREALLAWCRLPDAERKKTFDADAFPLPSDWAKKPITGDYVKDGKVKVKSIVTDRCVRCHADDEKAPFTDYESLSKYLK